MIAYHSLYPVERCLDKYPVQWLKMSGLDLIQQGWLKSTLLLIVHEASTFTS